MAAPMTSSAWTAAHTKSWRLEWNCSASLRWMLVSLYSCSLLVVSTVLLTLPSAYTSALSKLSTHTSNSVVRVPLAFTWHQYLPCNIICGSQVHAAVLALLEELLCQVQLHLRTKGHPGTCFRIQLQSPERSLELKEPPYVIVPSQLTFKAGDPLCYRTGVCR